MKISRKDFQEAESLARMKELVESNQNASDSRSILSQMEAMFTDFCIHQYLPTPLKGEPIKAQRFEYGKRHKKCSNCPRSIVKSNHIQNDVVVLTVTCPCLIFRLSLVVSACPAIPQKVTGLVLTFPLSWHFCCFLQWPRMSLVLNVLFCCCFALFSWLFFW